MAQVDIGDAATAGLRLIRRRPFSVLTWGLVVVGYVALILALFGGGVVAAIATFARNGSATPAPAQVFALVGSLFGVVMLLWLGLLILGAMIQGAALRAELEPDRVGFAYLRFGRQELWLIAARIVQSIVLGLAQVAMAIPLGIVAGAMFAVTRQGHGGDLAGMAGLRALIQLVVWGLSIWLWVRLSMGPVMSFRERQFRLFESWTLTRGHAGEIFLSMLLVGLIMIAFYILVWIVAAIGLGATMFATFAGASAQSVQGFFSQAPDIWLAKLAPAAAILALLLVVIVGVANALLWGAIARIYHQLKPDADVAATFA
jgi:hypothetical protein